MTMLRQFLMFALIVSLCPAGSASAQEVIDLYLSDIEIQTDGSMLVTETIKVKAEGRQIRRGIYRDFPTRYEDRYGHNVDVTFELLGATRDGSPEPNHTEKMPNGIRVYLGSANVMLRPALYTYEIRYKTRYQLGFFDGFDELYWNATGNGWIFPITKARARIRLPQTVEESQLKLAAYTGRQGVAGSDYQVKVDSPASVTFESTRRLAAYEGLTIAVGFPKGIVLEPTLAQKAGRFLRNNGSILAGLLGATVVFIYYVSAWRRVGRDPAAGIVIPRYGPPEGYSPASLRYIWRMKYDSTAFAAALVNLAVKEKVQIHAEKKFLSKNFSVTQDREKDVAFSPGEAALFRRLLGARTELKFEQNNHSTIKSALTAHEKSLRRDYQKTYFLLNKGPISIGVMLSGTSIAATTSTSPRRARMVCSS